ncbi:hypothetical protein [Bradyrhizobium sp.]|uniref:hypothetical protein n=1 Tax=Bradyrhizobium sp. TaxID=376 RepID=UPI001EBC2242|nr:hypothetical protein [Bradyrhizobium sp.]MBV9984503.1 hypothetical protein [Bradyrhizobium sp.]
MLSFGQYARHLERSLVIVKPELEIGLARVGEHTKVMAANYIGHELPEWKPLAPATVKEKTELGYVGHVSATDPLLRTGANEQSIGVAVEGLTQAVGSPRKEFLYMEMGTDKVPPRPAIGLAAVRSLPYAGEVFGMLAMGLLAPGFRWR